jgi:arylsulfatase A-like enzyme
MFIRNTIAIFRSGLLLTVAFLALAGPVCAAEQGASRPNFLFIVADDQRWDAMGVVQREQGGHARFPWLKTPNIDRLAAEGVRFRNAFCTSSLCSPSRACFLTGRYNHLNGIASNNQPFPVGNVTHATELRKAGYATAMIGKWHMDHQKERPGFDFSASYLDHGVYDDCPFLVNGVETQTKGWVDRVATDYAIDFLRQHKDQPFDMMLGYKSPHTPWHPPEHLKNLYANDEAATPANAYDLAIYRKLPMTWGSDIKLVRNYFRVITAMDEELGRLLNALDELKLTENTVVVFVSDNGMYWGEHGLADKRSAYDDSMRIPMIVRYPRSGMKGRTVDDMVLNIDLAPTLLDYAGVPVPAEMQGKSWRSLVDGKPAGEWRKSFLYEYFLENWTKETPTITAVRTEKAKLIKYRGHDEWTELFDLSADPNETKNLIADPASERLRLQLEQEYDRQVKETQYRVPDYAEEQIPVRAPRKPVTPPKQAD